VEQDAQTKLLDGLYSWLASPTSLMHDAALLRKVHQYMDKVLQLFIMELTKCDCKVIHASYSRILFATTKVRVIPDVQHFWSSLCGNVRTKRVLQPLAIQDVSCLSELFYGVMWLDPANWAGIPINPDTGEVVWKARSSWKIAEFLPPAVRPSLILYAGELLVGPQRELYKRTQTNILASVDEAGEVNDIPDAAEGKPMDEDANVEDEPRVAMEVDGICNEKEDAPMKEPTPAVEAAPEAGLSVLKGTELIEGLREFVRGEFFEDIRCRILHYMDDLQVQQQRELPGGLPSDTLPGDMQDNEDSDDEINANDGQTPAERKAEKMRRHLEQKWSFPVLPGRRAPPGALDFEFMRTLVCVLQLEDCLQDQVMYLRESICKKLKMSSFRVGIDFMNPCFPLLLRDVVCPWCCTSSHLDVTSHPANKAGSWICLHCKKTYEKDAVQARLVDLLETAVQAWQSQEITCRKCKRMRNTLLQSNCECFGLFQARFKDEDFRLVLKILRSLVAPHELQWLGEMLDLYEQLL